MGSLNDNKPLVSISCITYNHVNFIEQALNGFLMQKTNFNFEVLIHDDASTDGTEQIIRAYERKFPTIIKPLYEETNQWVKGKRGSAVFNFPRAKGKYIALCEGDDYWTDPLKLQKQVDFLEVNTDHNICFNIANLIIKDKKKLHNVPKQFIGNSFNYIELLKHYNFITTASVIFRKPNNFELPEAFYELPFGDLAIYKFVVENKKIYNYPEVMSVYRIHDKGVWSGLNKLNEQKTYLAFYKGILQFLNIEEAAVVKLKIKALRLEVFKLSIRGFLKRIYLNFEKNK